MSTMILLVLLVAAGVILVHCVCVAAKMSRRRWQGHKARFAGVSASIALMAGGAVGLLLECHYAPVLLATGVAGSFVFDRREIC